jgi:DNA-binding HxlR family transcriptional regulator
MVRPDGIPEDHALLSIVAALGQDAWAVVIMTTILKSMSERDRTRIGFSALTKNTRQALTRLANDGLLTRHSLRRSYGYRWSLTDAGREAIRKGAQ